MTLSYAEARHVASEDRMIQNGGKGEWRKPSSVVNTGLYNCHVEVLKTTTTIYKVYILQALLQRMQ